MVTKTMLEIFFLSATSILVTEAVINGYLASPLDMRATASIFSHFSHNRDDERTFCGGVLISRNTILTAAHCLYKDGYFPMNVQATVNDYNTRETEPMESSQNTRAIDVLPDYQKAEAVSEDLALLYLPSPISPCFEFNGPEVARLPPSTATLPSKANLLLAYYTQPISDEEISSAWCFINGWGITQTGNYSQLPMTMPIRLSVESSAEGKYLIGTSFTDVVKLCVGDSGSPVYCKIRAQNYVVGIVSEIGAHMAQKDAEQLKDQDELSKCMKYDHVKIVDLRSKMDDVWKLFKSRKMTDELATGQRLCQYA